MSEDGDQQPMTSAEAAKADDEALDSWEQLDDEDAVFKVVLLAII